MDNRLKLMREITGINKDELELQVVNFICFPPLFGALSRMTRCQRYQSSMGLLLTFWVDCYGLDPNWAEVGLVWMRISSF